MKACIFIIEFCSFSEWNCNSLFDLHLVHRALYTEWNQRDVCLMFSSVSHVRKLSLVHIHPPITLVEKDGKEALQLFLYPMATER